MMLAVVVIVSDLAIAHGPDTSQLEPNSFASFCKAFDIRGGVRLPG